jgi:hypothetical protein
LAKNKFITNSSNTSTGYPNISARKAFKILKITHMATYCQLTLNTPISNTELSAAITSNTHTITIRANGFYTGIENCKFTKDSNNVFNISSNGQNPFPTSLAYDTFSDSPVTGNIRNILIFDDHPDWGETELNYFNFASGILNQCGTRNTASFGQENQSIGEDSICVGYKNKTGYFCGAFGEKNKILGHSSYGFGRENTIIADPTKESMFAFGTSNTINASNGVAIGNSNEIHGTALSSICIGSRNHTFGKNSFAGGSSCIAYGHHSFAYGQGLQTKGAHTTLFGRWATINDEVESNAINGVGKIAFAVGNGSYNDATETATRSNALALDWEGNLELGGQTISLKSPDGTRFKIKVSNDGTLITEKAVE